MKEQPPRQEGRRPRKEEGTSDSRERLHIGHSLSEPSAEIEHLSRPSVTTDTGSGMGNAGWMSHRAGQAGTAQMILSKLRTRQFLKGESGERDSPRESKG